MRLLMLPRYGPLGASSRLRMSQYIPHLAAADVQVHVAPLLDDAYVRGLYAGSIPVASVLRGYWQRFRETRALQRYDAVWLEKESWPWLPGWLEQAMTGHGARLIVDYDDAVFHRYDRHRSGLMRMLLGTKIDALMAGADMVTAGNDYLAERARAAGCRRVEWLPTVIDLRRYPTPRLRAVSGPVVVGWMGSPSTAIYLHAMADALAPLQVAGLIRCVAVGARPDQVEGTPFEAQPWQEATEVEQLQGFDIGIMPLPDDPWERGKCGYKLIQYMACGLPVVASPVGVNTRIVQHGGNGLLAETTMQWKEAVGRLAADAELRWCMGQAGRRQVEEVYCLQVQAGRLLTMLRDTSAG